MNDYVIYKRGNLVHKLANIVSDLDIGTNCRIDAFVTITGKVQIGNNVHIGTGVSIFGTHGVRIKDGVSLSGGCKIFTATDDPDIEFVTNPTLKDHMGQIGFVEIGMFSSIGAGSVILPGVTIGDEVQVGALSLVKNSLKSNSVYAGIPARRIKNREKLIYGYNPGQS